MSMSQIAAIFRAYDIRGVVGDTLTPELVYQIGQAIGAEALAQGLTQIAIGRDGRLSGPELSQALSNGLLSSGCDVLDIGAIPTPVLYFATYQLNTQAGVMLTGSHNPAEYNGLKMVLGGVTLAEEQIQQLYQRIIRGDFCHGHGHYQRCEVTAEYLATIQADIQLARPLRVVIDCGNGITGMLAPRLFRNLGCDVIELFCEVDGHFPNHHPDPSQPENLTDLIRTVKAHQADVGLAFDGDGDRLGVVTEQGEIIWADRQLMLYALDILQRHPGAKIIYDVKCSRHLGKLITQHGGEAIMWKTGHSLVKAKMRETGALLAGEMSGHTFFKERWFGFDDGLYTAARLLAILAQHSEPCSAIFAKLPNSLSTPELKIAIADEDKFNFMQSLIEQAQFPDSHICYIDGLRVDFEDGWGLIRPSNTTPCLVLRFEADNPVALMRIQQLFRQQLLQLNPDLSLPF